MNKKMHAESKNSRRLMLCIIRMDDSCFITYE